MHSCLVTVSNTTGTICFARHRFRDSCKSSIRTDVHEVLVPSLKQRSCNKSTVFIEKQRVTVPHHPRRIPL